MAKPSFRFKIPKEVTDTLPKEWGKGIANAKGAGRRWLDPKNPKGRGVRIDKGNAKSNLPSQRVVVRDGGRVIGRNGEAISGSINLDPNAIHTIVRIQKLEVLECTID